MLSSIRNKIVFGVLILILSIQIISAALQSFQVRAMFIEEFLLGAQNLSQTSLLDLTTRVETRVGDDAEASESDIKETIDLFVYMIQYQKFESILESNDDLKILQFVNSQNILIVKSSKTEEGYEHLSKAKTEDLKADPWMEKLAEKRVLDSVEKDGQIHVYVPYTLKDVYYGGMILTYSNDRIASAINGIIRVSILLAVLFTLISIALVIVYIKRVLGTPIQQMIELMNKLANGELNQRFSIKNKDEIGKMGKSVNELVESLQIVFKNIGNVMGGVEKGDLSRQITADLKGELNDIKSRINKSVAMLSDTISVVQETSKSVGESARELSTSADNLSAGSSRQAATLEEISSTISEVESHSRQNTEYSQDAKKVSGMTLELVKKGNLEMEDMQQSMDQINNTSLNVTKIIKVIDEIAFQTNLLALNAAVEAARAGKYGKGFAVVAEEVRNLAAKSAEAAKNTAELIETSIKEVDSGVGKASNTSKLLKEIVSEMEKSDALISQIAESSQKQNTAISEIYNGISQVNDTVQQNSAIAQETASSSEILLDQSTNLQKRIDRFKLQETRQELELNGNEIVTYN